MSTRASTAIAGKSSAEDAALDTIFSALSNRTRRRILARLSDGAATVGELAAPFSMSLPAVSKHIRILEGAGLLRRERDGWYHHCRLQGRPLEAAREFIDRYRAFWGRRSTRWPATSRPAGRPSSRARPSRFGGGRIGGGRDADERRIGSRRRQQAGAGRAAKDRSRCAPTVRGLDAARAPPLVVGTEICPLLGSGGRPAHRGELPDRQRVAGWHADRDRRDVRGGGGAAAADLHLDRHAGRW